MTQTSTFSSTIRHTIPTSIPLVSTPAPADLIVPPSNGYTKSGSSPNPDDPTSVVPQTTASSQPLVEPRTSTHPTQTRSDLSIFKPKVFLAAKKSNSVTEALQHEQ